jgi:hypothetical protein
VRKQLADFRAVFGGEGGYAVEVLDVHTRCGFFSEDASRYTAPWKFYHATGVC